MEGNKDIIIINGKEYIGRKKSFIEILKDAPHQVYLLNTETGWQIIEKGMEIIDNPKLDNLREIIEAGIEFLERNKIPSIAMRRGTSIDYDRNQAGRRKRRATLNNLIINNKLPKNIQESLLIQEMDGYTLFLFFCLVDEALKNGTPEGDNQIKITVTLSSLSRAIFPYMKNETEARHKVFYYFRSS